MKKSNLKRFCRCFRSPTHTWSSFIATHELAGKSCRKGTRNCRQPFQWASSSIRQIRLKILINIDATLKNWKIIRTKGLYGVNRIHEQDQRLYSGTGSGLLMHAQLFSPSGQWKSKGQWGLRHAWLSSQGWDKWKQRSTYQHFLP